MNGTIASDGVRYLLDLNAKHSAVFTSEAATKEREDFRDRYKCEYFVFKCMDGRLNVSTMTQTQFSILQPLRNVGAKFRYGWPLVREIVDDHYEYSLAHGRAFLQIATYHFSRGSTHRGCAGFKEDTDKARAFASDFKRQLIRAFENKRQAYAILVGIETDLDALVLHGDDEGDVLDLATVVDVSEANLRMLLANLYPGMPRETLLALFPLVKGNIEHIREVRASNRPVTEITHQEWVLGFGRGFDWLHEPNTAILLGPFDPEDLRTPLVTAAQLLWKNLNSSEDDSAVKKRGVVLMSASPYYKRIGYEARAAREKSEWQHEFAMRVIRKEVPELLPHLRELTGIVNMKNRKLEVLHSN